MPAFRFEAADAVGRIERGLIDADSPRHARALLREQALVPLEVELLQSQPAGERRSLGPRLRAGDLALATRQLASLLSARLPLEQALDVVVEQAEGRVVRERFAAVRAEVVSGQTLASALAGHPRDFPEVYRALVAAGEQSGDLAGVMTRLADYIETRGALIQRVALSFIYPAIVTAVASAVVIVLLTYVVPQVIDVFRQTGQALPFLTRALIVISDFTRGWGWAVALTIAACALAWRTLLRSPTVKLAWHKRALTLPIAGRLLSGLETARFASTLSILVASGVPLIRALEAGAQTLANEALRHNVEDAIGRVREGVTLARALAAAGRFPPLMVHLIASGEATGALAEMLERAARALSSETERRALALTSLLEPLLILAMGAIVLLIVLAVMLPIIEINQLVR
jgi:general secretion pathway protein F